MLAATETTKDSILSIIITPFQKKAGFGQRKDYSTKLTFRTVFQKMCLCFFGVEDSLDMADLFFVLLGNLPGGDVMRLFCVRMYCIFSTLPLDVENTATRTQSLKVAFFGRMVRKIFVWCIVFWFFV